MERQGMTTKRRSYDEILVKNDTWDLQNILRSSFGRFQVAASYVHF
jgi:hypothetical protein